MATPATVSSDAGLPMSDGASRAPRQRRANPSSSSLGGRPRGPPSESVGAQSDGEDNEGFEDDQVPKGRPIDTHNIPKVEDKLGVLVQKHFEDFIEGYDCLAIPYVCVFTDNLLSPGS